MDGMVMGEGDEGWGEEEEERVSITLNMAIRAPHFPRSRWTFPGSEIATFPKYKELIQTNYNQRRDWIDAPLLWPFP
jgi:hypothetical protein